LDLPSNAIHGDSPPSYRTLFSQNGEPHYGEYEVPRPVPLVFTDFEDDSPAESLSRSDQYRTSLPFDEEEPVGLSVSSTEDQEGDRLRSINTALTKGSKGQPIIIVYGGKAKRKYRGGGKGKKKRGQQSEYLPIHHFHRGNEKHVPHHYDPWGHEYNPKQPPPAVLHHIMREKYKKTHNIWYQHKNHRHHHVHASSHSGTFGSHYWDNLFRRLSKGAGILGVADYDNHYGKHGSNPLTKNRISYHSGFYTEIQ